MKIWQTDFYYFPSQIDPQQKQWELNICELTSLDPDKDKYQTYSISCSVEQANAQWLTKTLATLAANNRPDRLQVFRPEALGLITSAGENLGITVEATRNTPILKQVLAQKYPDYNVIQLDKPVPQPLPENLWGEEWQIANINAGQIIDLFRDRPMRIAHLPTALYPLNLGIASSTPIPGIIVYGGRKSLQLARWIEAQNPAFMSYIPTEIGKSGGFILETGLVERWVFNTFESESAAAIARNYEQKKQTAQGLHFILIQPDNSGMTYTALWLLQQN